MAKLRTQPSAGKPFSAAVVEDAPAVISTGLAQRIFDELGENVYLCYQCVKCTSGCPLAEFFDWQPNQVMRLVQLGQEQAAFQAESPWLCASCQTCSTRCPQGIDIAAVMDYLTRAALANGYKPSQSKVQIFNEAFLREVRLWGRAYELGLMAEMKLRTGEITEDMDLAVKMFRRNKLAFFPSPARPPKNVKPAAGAAWSVAYYPGCSLHSTASEFNRSTEAVCEKLGLNLIEPEGWICCGSSAAHRSDPEAALRLPLENLATIEKGGFKEVTMPCAACFNRHKFAQYELRQDPTRKSALEEEMEYTYQDSVEVTTLAESLLRHIGVEQVERAVVNSLKTLNLVCYYGCLLTRPTRVTGASHPDNPTELDRLMAACGAQVHDWSYKTSCCGAVHSLTRSDIVLELSRRLIEQARLAGAEAIVVACPLCHTNLDARQTQMKLADPMPVLYFTQLMALALGVPEHAAFNKNLIDPRPLLKNKGFSAVH